MIFWEEKTCSHYLAFEEATFWIQIDQRID